MPLNILAWNNEIGPWYYFVGLRTEVMINRDSWGYSYSIVRGEILGFLKTNYCESIYQGCFH
jgi:hypothetical protein